MMKVDGIRISAATKPDLHRFRPMGGLRFRGVAPRVSPDGDDRATRNVTSFAVGRVKD